MAAPDCDRCPYAKVLRGTETRTLRLDGLDYTWRLCKQHALLFDVELRDWTQLTVGREPAPTWRPTIGAAGKGQSARDNTAEIQAIQRRALDRRRQQEKAEQKAEEDRLVLEQARREADRWNSRRQTAVLADIWHLTEHAAQRARERGFTEEEVLRAANDPEATIANLHNGLWRHWRGRCCAVVDRDDGTVVTVFIHGEREDDDAATAN